MWGKKEDKGGSVEDVRAGWALCAASVTRLGSAAPLHLLGLWALLYPRAPAFCRLPPPLPFPLPRLTFT
jgi:hypothetical protein